MQTEKKYCGNGKFLDRLAGNNYRIYLNAKGLATIMQNVNAQGGIALDFMERRQPDQYNNTHYLAVNEYRGNSGGGGNRQYQQPPQQQQSRYSPSDRPPRQYSQPPAKPWDPDDDIPF